MTWDYLANVGIGYLLGAVPYGLILGYLWTREDIRTRGSGKTGVTNVLRTAGKVPAALVMVSDIGKGVAPALIGRYVFDDAGVAAAGAGAAIVGHIWPAFAGFRGGRGVATAFGGALGLTPLVALVFPVIGALLIAPTRIVSLMSVVGTPLAVVAIAVAATLGHSPWAAVFYGVFALALIEYMHIPNIRRLLAGTEPRIGEGGDRPASG